MGRILNEGGGDDADPVGETEHLFGPNDKPDAEAPTWKPTVAHPHGRRKWESDEDPDSASGEDPDATIRGDPTRKHPQPVGWLVVVGGPGIGSVLTIRPGMNVIARGPEANLRLNFGDKRVSNKDHVRLEYDAKDRKFYLIPGTGDSAEHNGQKVRQPHELSAGDTLIVGGTSLRFMPFCDTAFDWTDL